jgi:hypothetical protein
MVDCPRAAGRSASSSTIAADGCYLPNALVPAPAGHHTPRTDVERVVEKVIISFIDHELRVICRIGFEI